MTPPHELVGLAAKLTEGARRDVLDGNCIMGAETCLCGSSVAVKGELAQHCLIKVPEDPDGAFMLNRNGLALRSHLIGTGNG